MDRSQLYSSIKIISNYIKGETSKFTKTQLSDIISGLGKSFEKMYVDLFGTKFTEAHDAMVDVESTLECYIQLKNMISQNNKPTIPVLTDFIV